MKQVADLAPRALQFCNNSSGFSLMNIMIGIALVSVVSMTSAFMAAQTKKAETEGESLYHLNQEHILALHKSKSLGGIKATLGITPTSSTGQCLAGRGSGCNALTVAHWTQIPGMSTLTSESNGRTIATVGQYKLECSSPTVCEALLIQIDSTLRYGTTVLYSRHSEVRVGGIVLADRRAIDFSCASASGGLLTAMNMQTLRGECLPLPASNACPSGRPLTTYHVGGPPGCQPGTALNCPTGFQSVGILSGQGDCI